MKENGDVLEISENTLSHVCLPCSIPAVYYYILLLNHIVIYKLKIGRKAYFWRKVLFEDRL